MLFPSLLYIVVCVLFACGSGKISPRHPLAVAVAALVLMVLALTMVAVVAVDAGSCLHGHHRQHISNSSVAQTKDISWACAIKSRCSDKLTRRLCSTLGLHCRKIERRLTMSSLHAAQGFLDGEWKALPK